MAFCFRLSVPDAFGALLLLMSADTSLSFSFETVAALPTFTDQANPTRERTANTTTMTPISQKIECIYTVLQILRVLIQGSLRAGHPGSLSLGTVTERDLVQQERLISKRNPG